VLGLGLGLDLGRGGGGLGLLGPQLPDADHDAVHTYQSGESGHVIAETHQH
jgi:hypothetical protein